MTFFIRLPLAIAMLGVIALGTAGCSFAPPVQFYQLQQIDAEQTSAKSNAMVLLGPLKIADYLQRENILQREPDGSLRVSQQARWAGSLQDDIGRFVLRQIAAELGSSRIALYPDRVGIDAQAQVVLSISRLDSGLEQPAVLEAQWRLLDDQGILRDSQVVRFEEQHTGEMSDQVRAQSDLLNQLTKQLVAALRNQLPRAAT
ncbi:MAG TPA: ABC-type transport auxiliary lipoprotein family protein, partial [Thiopseudomonas sp.]|nr:ABC-type transport auxiliary lipoprotein family protein [Thiopseudomonas sp.]